ncbi:MAG: 5'/3'-nucleotidase SurE [Dehalogenimonas sp.]
MKILISNDDGINAAGLWALATHVSEVAPVAVVAPDREQSATGTAITLRQPLRVRKTNSPLNGIECCFAVEGMPGDAVILALENLVAGPVDLVISGINNGPNLGDDVLISGTVGAALQGYLRNIPAIAISTAGVDSANLEVPARLAAIIAADIHAGKLRKDIFLNLNVPDLPLKNVKGIELTVLAHKTNIDSVKEGHDGRREFYWLVRRQLDFEAIAGTDIKAIEQDCISVTELHTNLFHRPTITGLEAIAQEWFKKLRQ